MHSLSIIKKSTLILLVLIIGLPHSGISQETKKWHGYEILDSTLNGKSIKVVFPELANTNRDWIWRARFWGHEPQTDIALLEHGFHVVYIDVAGLFGNEEAVEIWDEFYKMITNDFHLNQKVVLEGMSRGGLIIYNWAAQNAKKVSCIYGDAPVCDFKSWSVGNGVDQMENIAKEKIPILHVVGDADQLVPVSENTDLLSKSLIELGWEMKVIHKPGVGHHPHSLKDPKPIVDFILRSTGNKEIEVAAEPEWSRNNITIQSDFKNCKIQFEQEKKGHVAFIGGSITEMDGYRPMLCDYLQEKFIQTDFTFTNAGIASTGSTTGAFRLERDVLSKGPLDLLFLEFAVNDDQDTGDSFTEAMLGMEGIIRKAREYNPYVDIVITYFVNPEILENYQNGIVRTSLAAHDKIAKHYKISTCNLAKEVADQITIGTLDWETFGGTHPKPFGNAICKNMICTMLEEAWSQKEKFITPAPVNKNNIGQGRLIDPAVCDYSREWSVSIPDWDMLKGIKRERFMDSPMLWTTKKGAKLALEFNGAAMGVYILSGPDAGTVEVSIDGGPFVKHDLYHKKYSKNLHYPQTIMFANDLNDGKHTLELRMLKESSGIGNAARIMYFVEN